MFLFQVLRVSPVRNSAALVFREPGVYPFVKYVNCKAGDRHYYVINCSFYGFTLNDYSTGDSEESLESSQEVEEDDEAGPSRDKFESAKNSDLDFNLYDWIKDFSCLYGLRVN